MDAQPDRRLGLDNAGAGRTAAYLISRALGDVQGMILATRSHERFLGEEERESAFVEALAAKCPGLQVLALQGGSGVDIETSRLLKNSLDDIHDLHAVYSMGGGNRSILRTLEDNGLRPKVYVAHDLDKENRELILDKRLDFVLHHDLQLDIRNVFNAFLNYHNVTATVQSERDCFGKILLICRSLAGSSAISIAHVVASCVCFAVPVALNQGSSDFACCVVSNGVAIAIPHIKSFIFILLPRYSFP